MTLPAFIIHGAFAAGLTFVLGLAVTFPGHNWWMAGAICAAFLTRELFLDPGGDNGAIWRLWRWTPEKHLEWIVPALAAAVAAWAMP